MFLVLAAKAPATVWKVKRSAAGRIVNIERRSEYVIHYSFHIIDPTWGHVTIKMSGHPPFGAQIILNGHEYVARQAMVAGIAFTKVGNCFTAVADPAGLARIADALSQHAAVGRLGQVCQRWIYTACLCFGLDLDEQQRSGFGYGFAVYQLEYSRNLIFADGHADAAGVRRGRGPDPVPAGCAQDPHRFRRRAATPPHPHASSLIEAAIETPSYDLTVFKLHFGRLTGKAYTKDDMCWGTPSVQTLVAMASVMFQELEEVPMTMVGGLDVHRQQITFDYVDDDGLVHWGQIRPATRQTLRGWLAEHFRDGDADFALEGCTGWRYVSEELAAAGLGVHLGDPAETAALRGRKKRAKTDRADARLLRTLLVEGRFPESWIPPAHVVEVRTLGRLYCTLMDERRAWQQRIHAQLFHQGCPPIRALLTRAGRAALAGAELSAAGRQYVDTALRRIDELSAEIDPLRTQLISFARRQPGCRALQRHYGVGWLCAVIIWAEIGDARRFSSSDQLVRFAGLDVTVYSSDAKRAPGHLSRQGCPELRWAAFEAAKSAARRGSPDHGYYHQLAAKHDGHNGKNPTLAVERKILRRCYHSLRELGDAALALPDIRPQEVAA